MKYLCLSVCCPLLSPPHCSINSHSLNILKTPNILAYSESSTKGLHRVPSGGSPPTPLTPYRGFYRGGLCWYAWINHLTNQVSYFVWFFQNPLKIYFVPVQNLNQKIHCCCHKKDFLLINNWKLAEFFFFILLKNFFVCSIGHLQAYKSLFWQIFKYFSTSMKDDFFVLIQDFYFENTLMFQQQKYLFCKVLLNPH